ncbi:hypothetical protein KZZ08_21535, partial [Roseovarius mucosus]|uniref:hypothetical protein n=1 Tax=Roseovarius mucosus TaxID=215743 RepID=UPI001C5EDADD
MSVYNTSHNHATRRNVMLGGTMAAVAIGMAASSAGWSKEPHLTFTELDNGSPKMNKIESLRVCRRPIASFHATISSTSRCA